MANEPTFVPTVNPKFGVSDSREPRVRRIQYGDGYTGRQPDGINVDPQKIKLTWENLLATEVEPMFRFFEALRGASAFFYEVPIGLGDDWFEVSVQGQASTQTTFNAVFFTANTNGSTTVPTTSTTSGFAMADPKLYANGILVPLTYQNDLANASWTKSNLAVQGGLIKTPSGLYMPTQVLETGANGTAHQITSASLSKAASAMPIKAVAYIKALGIRKHIGVRVGTGGGTSTAVFNLTTAGAVVAPGVTGDVTAHVSTVRKLTGPIAKFIAPKYEVERDDVNAYSLQVELEQVFEA